MACLDMYNNPNEQHKGLCTPPPMSPRISFSNDFVESSNAQQHLIKHEMGRPISSRSEAPVSSDFEFSVTNYSMMSGADELFFKGRLLPFKDSNCTLNGQLQKTTLRDELLVDDDDDDGNSNSNDGFLLKPPKGGGSGSTRWKGLLGLKRTHIGSRKSDKGSDGTNMERVVESKRSGFFHEESHSTKTSKEVLNDEETSTRDAEMGI